MSLGGSSPSMASTITISAFDDTKVHTRFSKTSFFFAGDGPSLSSGSCLVVAFKQPAPAPVKPSVVKKPKVEVISRPATAKTPGKQKPPVLFVHGSFHAAWCFEEKFMPYFASKGYSAYAVSRRGHGTSERHPGDSAPTLSDYADDVDHAVDIIAKANKAGPPPVLVGHSTGGQVVERYMEMFPGKYKSAVLMNWGHFGPINLLQGIFTRPLDTIFIIWQFITKGFLRDPKACRKMFFTEDTGLLSVEKYMKRMAAVPMDLKIRGDEWPTGALKGKVDVLVLGGSEDRLVWPSMLDATAKRWGTKPFVFQHMGHDMMLDVEWQKVADKIIDWLDSNEKREEEEKKKAAAAAAIQKKAAAATKKSK